MELYTVFVYLLTLSRSRRDEEKVRRYHARAVHDWQEAIDTQTEWETADCSVKLTLSRSRRDEEKVRRYHARAVHDWQEAIDTQTEWETADCSVKLTLSRSRWTAEVVIDWLKNEQFTEKIQNVWETACCDMAKIAFFLHSKKYQKKSKNIIDSGFLLRKVLDKSKSVV